jgi:rhamnose transport system ATP-binding protein
MPLLEASSISKSYSGVRALKRVSFDLLPGEVHALVGENGAGKSTLIKIVTGAVAPDSGTLRIAGRIVEHHNPTQAHALGIAAVYQQPALFPDLTVAENIALAIESGGPWRRIDWKARDRAAREALARAGADIHPDVRVSSLSMPEQQIVEIAKAIGAHSKILILDEPTASLTDREVGRLFQVIASLRAEGAGIVYISHRLEEIAAIADRVTVLRDGETIATCDAKGLSRAELIRMMVGREIETIFPKRAVPIGEVALEVRNLRSRAAGIRGVSLEVRAGEILGLSGLVGSGRTQLAETIFGLTPAESGEIRLQGRAVRIASPADAIRNKIGYVPEDRRQHGVVMSMPICANISLANLPAVCGHGPIDHGLINGASENALARTYVERLRVKTHSIHAEAGYLSGGNQQKVALARWLAIQPAILILDEPTQGVDVGSKSEIHGLIVDLAEQGLAIIMISSELPEILGMSDRIAVMHAGKIAGVLSRAEATQENLLALALGHGTGGDGGPIENVA